ncbi:hypothetical protein P5P86_11925 [Nocardioides sp. BP30]|uniref:hypothetical protein n=1 Tax=Nocardioides sp. BP30 TaxID=3036374 RepID=UPI002468AF93|nr:hypothetical protein [Nocardioides sp. BP30]WGL50672.1 hypothetical protein P5P86_11925 [Nocardioides sp. BP30]
MTARYSLALRLVSAIRLGAVLVMRPRRPVAHLYLGPVTETGSFVRSGFAVLCGARTRRLSVVVEGLDGLGPQLRLCRRCAPLVQALAPSSPYAGRVLVAFDDMAAAFAHLTPADFETAARWCRTVDETYQVGTLSGLVLGPVPLVARTEEQRVRKRVDEVLLKRRNRLRNAELSPEERADRAARRELEADERARVQAARARADRIARANDRANRGQYLMPSQRELLAQVANE